MRVSEQALLLRTHPQLSEVTLRTGHTDLFSFAGFCVSLKSWVSPLHFNHSSPDCAPSVQFTCSVYIGTVNNRNCSAQGAVVLYLWLEGHVSLPSAVLSWDLETARVTLCKCLLVPVQMMSVSTRGCVQGL